jgi:protein O-mannosyl-transferase
LEDAGDGNNSHCAAVEPIAMVKKKSNRHIHPKPAVVEKQGDHSSMLAMENRSPLSASLITLLIGIGIWLGVMAIYFQVYHFEFVKFDDDDYVYKNPHVLGGLTVENVRWAFTARHSANWHPLTWLSHMLDVEIYQRPRWPGGPHLTNALLHATTAVLLFLAWRQLSGRLWPSAFAAAVFAVHPLRAESVAWVSERKDVLSGLFFCLMLLAYAGYARRPAIGRYALVILPFVLGLMAKPILVTAPFVLLLLDYWPLRRAQAEASLKRLLLEKVPMLALAIASSAVTLWAQKTALAPLDDISLGKRIANAALSYVIYLRQWVWPSELAFYYPLPHDGAPEWEVAAALAVLTAITALTLALRRRGPYLLVGWLWYLGMLVPVIGLVQVGLQAHADRYTYLPQMGLAVALSWSAADLGQRWQARPALYAAAAAVVLGALSWLALAQVAYWHDSIVLFTHALDITDNNAMAENNLGAALEELGRPDDARFHYRQALAMDPNLPLAALNYGWSLFHLGRYQDAATYLEHGLHRHPPQVQSIILLGLARYKLDEYDKAEACLREALRIEPRDAQARIGLGLVDVRRRQFERGVAHYREALDIEPASLKARLNLGLAFYQWDKPWQALAELREALRLPVEHSDWDYVNCLRWAAWLAATSEDSSVRNANDAVAWAEEAVQCSTKLNSGPEPSRADANCLKVLAAAYAEAGRCAQALETAQRALDQALLDQKDELDKKAPKEPHQERLRQRIQLADELRAQMIQYRAGKALRELPPASPW